MTDIGPVAALSEVVHLELAGTDVKDIRGLERSHQLRYLDLRNTKVPQEDIMKLRKLLPACEVVSESR